MNFELMDITDAADVLALDIQGQLREDGSSRYAMPCGSVMVEAVTGQIFFKVSE